MCSVDYALDLTDSSADQTDRRLYRIRDRVLDRVPCSRHGSLQSVKRSGDRRLYRVGCRTDRRLDTVPNGDRLSLDPVKDRRDLSLERVPLCNDPILDFCRFRFDRVPILI